MLDGGTVMNRLHSLSIFDINLLMAQPGVALYLDRKGPGLGGLARVCPHHFHIHNRSVIFTLKETRISLKRGQSYIHLEGLS